MSRFDSFQYVPSQTRSTLRDRFARKLRVYRQHHHVDPDLPIVSDQMALRLFDGLQISQNAQWHLAEAAYAGLPHSPGEPLDLATLRLSGRVRLLWGRAKICQEVRSAALRAPAGTMDALKALVRTIHDEHYDFTPEVRTNRALDQLVTDIDSKTLNPNHIIVQTAGLGGGPPVGGSSGPGVARRRPATVDRPMACATAPRLHSGGRLGARRCRNLPGGGLSRRGLRNLVLAVGPQPGIFMCRKSRRRMV